MIASAETVWASWLPAAVAALALVAAYLIARTIGRPERHRDDHGIAEHHRAMTALRKARRR